MFPFGIEGRTPPADRSSASVARSTHVSFTGNATESPIMDLFSQQIDYPGAVLLTPRIAFVIDCTDFLVGSLDNFRDY